MVLSFTPHEHGTEYISVLEISNDFKKNMNLINIFLDLLIGSLRVFVAFGNGIFKNLCFITVAVYKDVIDFHTLI